MRHDYFIPAGTKNVFKECFFLLSDCNKINLGMFYC